MKRTNQEPIEYFFVASGNQAMRKTGNINTTSNSVNLSSGQFGIIALKAPHLTWGTYLGTANNPAASAANTAVDAPEIKFVQGTPASANTSDLRGFPGEHKPYVQSPVIRQNQIRSVSFAKPVIGTMSSHLISFPTVIEENVYGVHVAFRGTRTDRTFGDNLDTFFANYETPAVLPTEEQDLVNQNVAHQVNLMSTLLGGNKRVVALGINLTGGSGQALGTITSATNIPFMTYNGTQNLASNKNLVNTLKAVVDNTVLTNTSTIEVIDIATAGAAAKVTHVLIIGLDEVPARAYSGIANRRSRIDVSVVGGTEVFASRAREDEGQGYQLIIKSDESNFYNGGTTELANHSDFLLKAPQYIDPNALYSVAIIDLYDDEPALVSNPNYEKRLFILLPATDDSATATVAAGVVTSTNASSTVTDLEAIFKPWLKSNTQVEYLGDQTASVIFS
jgi:hypothetical protein